MALPEMPRERWALVCGFLLLLLVSYGGGAVCRDGHSACRYWATSGECVTNPGYMMCNCPDSCATPGICDLSSADPDRNCMCRLWAKTGGCSGSFVNSSCPQSCTLRQSKSCKPPTLGEGVEVVPILESYPYSETVTLKCQSGYQGNVMHQWVTCEVTGSFVGSGPDILCQKIPVPQTTPQPDPASTTGSHGNGSQATTPSHSDKIQRLETALKPPVKKEQTPIVILEPNIENLLIDKAKPRETTTTAKPLAEEESPKASHLVMEEPQGPTNIAPPAVASPWRSLVIACVTSVLSSLIVTS